MKKILYIMHCDWYWIKQRPHFLAEELGKDNEVYVTYRYSYNKKGIQNTPQNDLLRYFPIYLIPKGDNFSLFKRLNQKLLNKAIRRLQKKIKPDVIYVCSPIFTNAIEKTPNVKVIYDCMDDHYALSEGNDQKIVENETKLVAVSDIVLASSEYLKNNVLPERGCKNDKVVVVKNGFIPSATIKSQDHKKENDGLYHIGYIGTISSWFDFASIKKSINEVNNIVFHLVGPVSDQIRSTFQSERILFYGTMEHSQLPAFVVKMDCLIMPFIINDIVKAVDPVKLYEYIDFGKNIICSEYDEVKRFEPFVYFYGQKNLPDVIINVMNQNEIKYSKEFREGFLAENTWNTRAVMVSNLINNE